MIITMKPFKIANLTGAEFTERAEHRSPQKEEYYIDNNGIITQAQDAFETRQFLVLTPKALAGKEYIESLPDGTKFRSNGMEYFKCKIGVVGTTGAIWDFYDHNVIWREFRENEIEIISWGGRE